MDKYSDSDSDDVGSPPPKSKSKKGEGKSKKTPEKKSYRCDRCNFSSSSKAKYTKHAKSAHSGTVVQCSHCEFKTPYKWNLDRHYKNHLGGGALCCHLCNFSCDIKQSLTVHLQNHHSNVPEEIIESVKRQQIPPRNQSANRDKDGSSNGSSSTVSGSNNNTNATPNPPPTKSSEDLPSKGQIQRSESPEDSSSDGEKKVPPLRISRSLTGLSLGDENNSSDDASIQPTSNPPLPGMGELDKRNLKKCEHCDFETCGDGPGCSANVMLKKHLASQHGIHRKHHHHHKDHHKRERGPSSSPEYGGNSASSPSSSSPNIPIVPIPLPPKKSKGSTSPRPGQSASSTSNSPAIHRSQSPMKASEAISAFGSGGDHHNSLLASLAPSEPQTVLNLAQSTQLQSAGEESAFTPVLTGAVGDYTHAQISSLKKPKQRALAQFYQKIKPKFTTAEEDGTVARPPENSAVAELLGKEDVGMDEQQKNGLASSKSNRCQYCRQRCKSTADLAAHLEKCMEATRKEGGIAVKDAAEMLKGSEKDARGMPWNGSSRENEDNDGEYDLKGGAVNGSSDFNDGLIGFETAPGVGAIHTGKMEEMEYQGYTKDEIESQGEEGSESLLNTEDLDEEEEESSGGGKKDKSGKAQITNRRVYRCPENECSFWATTASRFHVHIVGHYNLKPFECSECHYKSNWRWDVNKHIRLKTPKDPKHAVAKTLLTHESGQRDYRKYDNYLVTMSLTHSANAKAPDCSTVATKRTKTPKSSPEIPHSAQIPKESPTGSMSSSSSASTPVSPQERKQKGKGKVLSGGISNAGQRSRENSPSYGGGHQQQPQHQEELSAAYPMDMAPPSNSSSEGRSFVETRMLAGGEIYQASLLKQDGISGAGEREKEEGDSVSAGGFDLSLKRPRSRHPHQEEEMRKEEVQESGSGTGSGMRMQNVMMPVIPTKKSRLHHHQQQEDYSGHGNASAGGGATNGTGNKILSMWQCIKCNFKHTHKDVVSSHIKELHKPKKGDPVSLLTHNHLIQVIVPEQDADALLASSTSGEINDFSGSGAIEQKKEIFQSMYNENGKVLSCKFCPFTTGLLYEIEIHAEHHISKSHSYYSCPHCSYSVAVKSELQEHLKLHGDVLEIQNRLVNSSTTITPAGDPVRPPMISPTSTVENLSMSKKDTGKKGHCSECPHVTNDMSEFQYHLQCHEPNGYPFKCHKCSYNVSVKLHLLQHLRVHGIQIDEVGVPPIQNPEYPQQYSHSTLNTDYESISDDGYSPNGTQDEPLNLSIFANRKPVVVYDTNGVAIEGYKCSVCPQIFQGLNDLKEHEYENNHRASATMNSGNGNGNTTNSSSNYLTSRQCDSPPMEAMNLSVSKLADHSCSNKKSSQSNSKVSNSGKRSVSSGNSILPQPVAAGGMGGGSNNGSTATSTIPLSLSSPSSLSSVDTVPPHSSSSSGKTEKEYIYLCDSCPARFFFEKELKIHHTFHENKSTFQCQKCTYSARQKDPHLMSHMRVHGAAYQEKTKVLLTKFPRGKVTPTSSSSTSSAAAAAYQAAAAALSAASLLNLNPNLLNSNFNFQTAAAALSSAAGKNAMASVASAFTSDPTSGFDGLRKNGLSIVCPKCPEKFYNAQAFQQHIEQHTNGRGGTEYRCRFCDYWAESRKALIVHEIVHTGSDISLEPAVAKLLSSQSVQSAFNPVSMMAMVAHQDSPFTGANNNSAPIAGGSNGKSPTVSGDQEVSEKISVPVPEEAYEGNPDFVYPTYMKNGRVKSKRYKCLKCPSAFEKKDQYHTHIGLHGSNQKYKCTVCDYAVTYYANYIQHLKKHENQRNIPTELLNLGRKRHQEEEGNGYPLKLSKLADGENSSSSSVSAKSNGSSFDSNSENQTQQQQQQQNQNRQKNGVANGSHILKCSACPFHCFDEASLETHMIHHQENPNWLHVCDICTFRTSSKKSLKEHARVHMVNGYHPVAGQGQQDPNFPHQMKNGGMLIPTGPRPRGRPRKDAARNKVEFVPTYTPPRDIEDISSDDGSL